MGWGARCVVRHALCVSQRGVWVGYLERSVLEPLVLVFTVPVTSSVEGTFPDTLQDYYTSSKYPETLGTNANAGNQQRGGPGGVVTPTTTVTSIGN